MSRPRWLLAPLSASLALATSPALADNLVANPGFESGSNGWSGGSVVQSSPHSGANCLAVTDDSPTQGVAASSALIPIVQGQAYAFEAWFRAAAENQQLLVSIVQFDASSSWLSGKNQDFVVTAGTSWSRLHMLFQSFDPQTSKVQIVLRPAPWSEKGEKTGTAWFDDIVFEPTDPKGTVRGSWLVANGDNRLWLGSTDQNVFRDKPLDAAAPTVDSIQVHAARSEFEAFQIVVLPAKDDHLASVTVSQLDGPAGAVLPASNVTTREVAYVNITSPSDLAAAKGPAPDPLPLLQTPIPLSAASQQPLWLTIRIPDDATAGDYAGTVRLSFDQGQPIDVPLRVHVWGFSVPKEHHHRSSFQLSANFLNRYHNLEGDYAKQREAFRLYLKDFSEHRIDPADPFVYDGYDIRYPGWEWGDGHIVEDPDVGASNHVLEVHDTKADASVVGSSDARMMIAAGKSYRISWRAKTDGAHDYLVSIGQHDADGNWISGHNIDFVKNGDGTWQSESEVIPSSMLFTPTATRVSVRLYARAWSAAGEKTGRTWFDDIVFSEEGATDNLQPNGSLEQGVQEAVPETDFSRFDPAAEIAFGELGFTAFRLGVPGFASMSYLGGEEGELLGLKWGTPEYEALITKTLLSVTNHLHDKGWLEKAYFYQLDEPDEASYPLVIEAMSLLNKADPRFRRLLTEQYEPALDGQVDIWSPILDQWGYDWAKDRQSKGEEVWWYTCTYPRTPYVTYFIDHPAIERRVSMWLAARFGVQGTLYWGVNYWSNDGVFPPPGYQDPWEDPMSYNFDLGVQGTWGNGDGRLLYPPRAWKDGVARVEGPTPSARWEQLRDGLEDLEYFWLLDALADQLESKGLEPQWVAEARALIAFPQELATSLTQFTDDPGELAAWRLKMGEQIEKMSTTAGPIEDAGTDGMGADSAVGDSAGADSAAEDGSAGSAPGASPDAGETDGCGCRTAGSARGAAWGAAIAALAWLVARRRRQAGGGRAGRFLPG